MPTVSTPRSATARPRSEGRRPGWTIRPAAAALATVLLAACSGSDLDVAVDTVAVCDDASWPLAVVDARSGGDATREVFVACSQEAGASAGPGFVERLVPSGDTAAELRSTGAVARFEYGVTGLAAADLSGDGSDELVATVAGPRERRLVVLGRDGDAGFVPLAEHVTGSTLSGPAVLDVDGDGVLDVVAPREGAWFANLGEASAPGPFEQRALVDMDQRLELDLADVSGDGRADVAHRDGEAGRLRLFARSSEVPDELPLEVASAFRTIYAGARLHDEGATTFVAGRATDPVEAEVVLLVPDGQGGLQASAPLEALGHPERALLADVVGNGRLDLVVSLRPGPDADAERLLVALGLPGGLFEDPVELRLDDFPYRPVVARAFGADDGDVVLAVHQETRQLVVVRPDGG